jgi:hypothetical protein
MNCLEEGRLAERDGGELRGLPNSGIREFPGIPRNSNPMELNYELPIQVHPDFLEFPWELQGIVDNPQRT